MALTLRNDHLNDMMTDEPGSSSDEDSLLTLIFSLVAVSYRG